MDSLIEMIVELVAELFVSFTSPWVWGLLLAAGVAAYLIWG